MDRISHEELKKLAQISQLQLNDDELSSLAHQIESILQYAARVKEIAQGELADEDQQVNVFRQDSIIKTDPEPLLALAPEHEEHFFVVPKIIESK
jgi:aspartyl-tRNA(Asn)/glutamyl-tRNA(Gln) amidotransferase subunit C